MAPAISTPVGPAPTSDDGQQVAAARRLVLRLGALEGARATWPRTEVASLERLQARGEAARTRRARSSSG